jgi:hypothetical protein
MWYSNAVKIFVPSERSLQYLKLSWEVVELYVHVVRETERKNKLKTLIIWTDILAEFWTWVQSKWNMIKTFDHTEPIVLRPTYTAYPYIMPRTHVIVGGIRTAILRNSGICGVYPSSYSMHVACYFPGVRRPGPESNRLPPYIDEFKSAWSHTFAPTYTYMLMACRGIASQWIHSCG